MLSTPKLVAEFILETLTTKQYRLDDKDRKVFKVEIDGRDKYMVIAIASNGYIITAHPYDAGEGDTLFSNNP